MRSLSKSFIVISAALLLTACNNDSKYGGGNRGGEEASVAGGALLNQVIAQSPNDDPVAINDLEIRSGGEDDAADAALN